MKSKRKSVRRAGVYALVTVLLFILPSCVTVRVVIDEVSEAEVLIPFKIKFDLKLAKDWTVPDSFPIEWMRGATFGKGSTILIDIPAGSKITVKDRVQATGNVASSDKNANATSVKGTVNEGSTYTLSMPDILGKDHTTVVNVTGTFSGEVNNDFVIEDGDGWRIEPGGFLAFHYAVNGGQPTWDMPADSPYFGPFDSEGTLTMVSPMSYESTDDLESVTGTAYRHFSDIDGEAWDFGFTGAFPVRMIFEEGVGIGANTIQGSINIE